MSFGKAIHSHHPPPTLPSRVLSLSNWWPILSDELTKWEETFRANAAASGMPVSWGWLGGDEKRELRRETQNSCHQEWGEMSSDQPEFFWQICYLRHISLSSWATANHSLPASRARRKMGSLSSAPNKRKTNKVTFSRITFMSDGKGTGHMSRAWSRFWGTRDRWVREQPRLERA